MKYTMPQQSQSLSLKLPGRNITHSRKGCTTCKSRRIRCSEERPSCTRCSTSGRNCTYTIQLHWEDESAGRGIKHGRGKSEYRFVDPTPSSTLVEISGWSTPDRCEHFVNSNAADIKGIPIQPLGISFGLSRVSQTTPHYALRTHSLDLSGGLIFQYFQMEVCRNLTLIDDNSNDFRHIILPMSAVSGPVMESLLALGAIFLSIHRPGSSLDYYAVALRYKQKALVDLREPLNSADQDSSDSILVSILLLCLLDITDNCQTSWATHLSAASKLIANSDLRKRQPSLVSFVSKFFAIRDIMGRSACGKKAKFKEIEWHDPQEIDKSVGCSYELMKIISNITDLARQLRPTSDVDSRELVGVESLPEQQILIETQLDSLTQLVPPSANTSERLVLTQISTIVLLATKIYFYTALHSAQPTIHIVKMLVTEQIVSLREVSNLRSAYLWSIFVTALYVHHDEERIFFLRQFNRLETGAPSAGSVHAAKAIVETVWKRRDLEADVPSSAGHRMSDWERIVRPMSEGLNLA